MVKKFILLLLTVVLLTTNLIAQENQSFLIQYKDGQKALISFPNSPKLLDDNNCIEFNLSVYSLKIPNHNIVKKGFVTQQIIMDSLTTKDARINFENDKVTLSNPQNLGYSIVFDNQFHQIECFPPNSKKIEFEINKPIPNPYWFSTGRILIGINTIHK